MPEGLEGERVDAGLARLFGFAGRRPPSWRPTDAVTLDGAKVGKSDRLHAGQLARGRAARAGRIRPSRRRRSSFPGLRVIFDDDDIVVVDKPVGVAAHPSPGWTGPDSRAAAWRRPGIGSPRPAPPSGKASCTGSTSAPRADGRREERAAYSALKQAFRERTVDKIYHALAQGHPDPLRGTIDAPIDRHPVHDYRWAVVAGGKPSVTHYETLEAFPRGAACSRCTSRPAARTRSASTWPRCGTPASATSPTARTPRWPRGSGLHRQWLHAVRLSFEHPVHRADRHVRSRRTRPISSTRSSCCATPCRGDTWRDRWFAWR